MSDVELAAVGDLLDVLVGEQRRQLAQNGVGRQLLRRIEGRLVANRDVSRVTRPSRDFDPGEKAVIRARPNGF